MNVPYERESKVLRFPENHIIYIEESSKTLKNA